MEEIVGASVGVALLPGVFASLRSLTRYLAFKRVVQLFPSVSSMGTRQVASSEAADAGSGILYPITLVHPHTPLNVAPGSTNLFPGNVAPDAAVTTPMVSLWRYLGWVSDAAAGTGFQNLSLWSVTELFRMSSVAKPGSRKYFPSEALLSSLMQSCCERKDMSAFCCVTTPRLLLLSRLTLDTVELGKQYSSDGGLRPSGRHTLPFMAALAPS
mmetsp:Transcript_5133/g.20951  ORF Transcript_5133/g.20951 Transcript_5133/m.20951 type:complete len:213 (+) Transcript_5133:1758-2396(+)